MSSLAAVADRHGIINNDDARRVALEPSDLARMVRSGLLTSLARGWYAVESPETPQARHALLTRAMLRSHEGRAVAGHHSALTLLGLPTYGADWETARLSRITPGSPRTRVGLKLGRCIPPEAVAPCPDGAPFAETVVPALAIAQVGISAGPLAALVAADGALHQELLTAEDLSAALTWVGFHPRTGALRSLLGLADGRHESPGETLLGQALHQIGLPVTPQFRVEAPGFLAFLDFLVDGTMVAIEFDGQVKYGRDGKALDPTGHALTPEQVLWAEKRREDHLRELGYEVVRVVWSELFDVVALSRRITAAIERSRARHLVRPA